MKKIIFTLSFLIMSILGISLQAQTLLLNEHFDYPAGDSLTIHNWVSHSGAGTNTVSVKNGSLTYNQYPASTGNSVYIKNTGQDINRTFAGQTSGTVYAAVLVKIDSASTTGDYFMHFLKPTSTFVGKVFVKKNSTTPTLFSFGISKTSNTAVYSSGIYSFDSTFLLVLRYKINTGTGNDSVSLFINPSFMNEGLPNLVATDVTSNDLDSAFSIALRQGTASNGIYLNLDELRISNSWNTAIGYYSIPSVTTLSTTNITTNSAICNGNVISNGGSAITARGICYDTIANPTILNTHTTETGELGSFSSNLTSLLIGKTYHYRTYATNGTGTVYGADSVFTTSMSAVLPIVTTNTASNISPFTATINGNVSSDGGAAITARGFCMSLNTNPSITDTLFTVSGTTGILTYNLTGLLQNTTYHIRAFATNSVGTSYGSDISFKTVVLLPTYTIDQVHTTNPTTGVADSIAVNCKLSGVVHGLNYITTGYSFYMMQQNTGIFVYKTSSLGYSVAEGDSIRVIGKTQQSNGLIYIAPDSIVKISSGNALQSPVVVSSFNDSLESRLVKLNNLTYLSGWPISAGTTKTVYALNGSDSVTIIIHSSCNLQGTAAPTATFNITGIETQNDATSPFLQGYMVYPRYLADLTINYTIPTVSTTSVSNISMTSAICSGNVTSIGGSAISARGICYGTTANPDTTGLHSTESGTTGVFSSTISGLTLGTLYHYRAYATNTTGVAYGADSTFTTASSAVLALVNTDSVYTIGTNNATIVAKVTNDGGATITTRGICWSTNTNPTILDSVSNVTGSIGTFSKTITTLLPNTTYYARAFATNSVGVSYGNQLTFTTKILVPSYTINQIKGNNASGVADSLNVNCKLTGIVHGLNYLSTTNPNGLTFFIMDSTAGINVYKTSNLGYTVTQGDKIRVIGKTTQISGLTEIVPDSIVVISTGNTLYNSTTVNLPDETVESKLVTINNLYYLSGWPTTSGTTKTVYTVKGQDTVILRIYNNCNLQGTAAPTATVSFSITGLVYQSDATSPYTSGYQILPRNTADLVINYTNPSVITGGTTGITQYTAICSGNVPTDGGHALTARGICYSTNLNPTTADSIRTVTATTGVYSANLSNLTLNTTYHYRAYAINSSGTFYGNDSTFTTALTTVVPVVTTGNATAIGFTNATVSGTIVNNGGDTILTKGICWGINHNPTINDSLSIVSGPSTTYSTVINNLIDNKVYYARAYATSAAGIGYGNEISFITKRLPPVYTISQIKSVNGTTGVADSLTTNCKLIGVVHGINFKQSAISSGYNFFIIDATSGINVFKTTTLSYTPLEGDLIRVIGKITQVSGLTEIVPDSIVLISSGNPLQTPQIISTLTENTESQLVKIANLTYISGWPTTPGFTTSSVLVQKGTDTITLRLFSNCNLQAVSAPTGTFNITGLVSQIDATSPYLSGYVLVPRDSNDMLITTGINELNSNKFSLYPNPSNGKVNIIMNNAMDAEINVYSLIGSLLLKQDTKSSFSSIDLSSYGKGVYFVNIINKSNGKSFTEKLIIN